MKKQIITLLTLFVFFVATTPFALATDYEVEMVVPDGKKSKETDAILRLTDSKLEVLIKKDRFESNNKALNYADIKVADYSYSKKPMLSAGGAVATALLVGVIFALPFLFMKKKNHWLALQTESEFAVLKLDGSNYRAIVADLRTRKVEVKEVLEEEGKSKNSKEAKDSKDSKESKDSATTTEQKPGS